MSEVITSKEQLICSISRGEKPFSQFGIGTEHEKFIFDSSSFRRLPYHGGGGAGICELLGLLRDGTGWAGIYEGDNIIGLRGADGGSVTLEPGGQFELSGAILGNIHQTCQEVSHHLRQVRSACQSMGAFALGMGFDPVSRRADISFMPKGRYKIMSDYMPKVGSMGLDMMLRTCTVQVNLDFFSEADMIDKMRIAIALQPFTTALFAYSPLTEGVSNGYTSYRSLAWFHTDNARCGMLPFVFDDNFGYERWVDYILDVPMYFIYRDGVYHDVSGLDFKDFMCGRLRGFEGDYPTVKDWEDHMTTAFPEVRLKSFIEMRGADGGAWCNLCALPAFWVGLLYDVESLSYLRSMISDWSVSEMEELRSLVPRTGLATEFRGRSLLSWCREILGISDLGLRNRGCVDSFGADERGFLKPLFVILDSGETMAETLMRDLRDNFGGDLRSLMLERAY